MSKHTQEPWSDAPLSKGNIVISETDWKRAVACVNALQDVEKPEEWRTIQIERIEEIVEVKQQRNRLLDALRSVADGFESGEIGQSHYDQCANLVEEFKAIATF